MLKLLAGLGLFAAVLNQTMSAQFLTQDSQADQYIAQVSDGGPPASRFTTLFRFLNSGLVTTAPANGTLYFYRDDGTPLTVDFGSGPASVFTISVPPQGSLQIETLGNLTTNQQGFVRAVFDSPVQVGAEFRNWQNGVFANGASVNGTTPSSIFWYSGDSASGIAIGNPNGFGVTCSGSFLNSVGNTIATNSVLLGPLHHTAFNIGPFFSLSSGTSGSFQLGCTDSSGNLAAVVSLGIAGGPSGITSALPNSASAFPLHHGEDIEKAFNYIVKVIRTAPSLSQYAANLGPTQLVIAADNTQINACAETPQSSPPCDGPAGTVKVWLSLAELLADSQNEMGWVVAHELGHVVQQGLANGRGFQMIFPLSSVNQTIETDADTFALIVSLIAGYDPYSAAGALGKIMMVTGTSTINAQYEENVQALLGTDMHTSVLNRVNDLYIRIQLACVLVPSDCQAYKNEAHPNFPVTAPLGIGHPVTP